MENIGISGVKHVRRNAVHFLLAKTPAIENGLEIPDDAPRYVALELDLNLNPIWAYFEDSLTEIKKALEDSDTSHVDRVRVYDLDSGQVYTPVWKIDAFEPLHL